MWGWVIIYVAVAIISPFLNKRAKTQNIAPGTIGDNNLPIASSSSPIPVVFGTVHLSHANVVWWGNLWTRAIKKKGGGKK